MCTQFYSVCLVVVLSSLCMSEAIYYGLQVLWLWSVEIWEQYFWTLWCFLAINLAKHIKSSYVRPEVILDFVVNFWLSTCDGEDGRFIWYFKEYQHWILPLSTTPKNKKQIGISNCVLHTLIDDGSSTRKQVAVESPITVTPPNSVPQGISAGKCVSINSHHTGRLIINTTSANQNECTACPIAWKYWLFGSGWW